MDGHVIDVHVFTRDGVEKDERALATEKAELAAVRKDLNDQLRILEDDTYARMRRLLLGKTVDGGPKGLRKGGVLGEDYLDELVREKWFEIRLQDEEANRSLERMAEQLRLQREAFDQRFEESAARSRPATTSLRACSRWSRSSWP